VVAHKEKLLRHGAFPGKIGPFQPQFVLEGIIAAELKRLFGSSLA
jgi:hypothetical protein